MDFALQPAAQSKTNKSAPTGNRLITDAELRLPGIEGLTIRYRRHWNLSFIEECVNRCRRLNKFYTLLVVGGEVKDPTTTSHLSALEKLIANLGAKYSKDDLCWGVHCGLPPYDHSEELFWGRPMPVKAVNANRRMMSAWGAAFPTQAKLLAGSANDPNAMKSLIEHGVEDLPGDFLYKFNSMSAKTAVTGWAGTDLIVHAAKAGALIGWESLDNSSASRFGGTWAQAMAKSAELEKRAGKKFSYRAHYKGDLAKVK